MAFELGANRARTPAVRRTREMKLKYSDEERERWEADAVFLGFPQFGNQYIRYILNARARGHLMLLDPASHTFFKTLAEMFGGTVGNILARTQRAFLEGRQD